MFDPSAKRAADFDEYLRQVRVLAGARTRVGSAREGWNDERIESLIKLWHEGLSASTIAARIGGITRNAVIGKVHRLGLVGRKPAYSPRPTDGRQDRADRERLRKTIKRVRDANRLQKLQEGIKRRLPGPPIDAEPYTPAPAPQIARITNIINLDEGAHHCKWVCDGGGWCGDKALPGKSWCEAHARVVFQPSQPRGTHVMHARFWPGHREVGRHVALDAGSQVADLVKETA